MESLSTKDFNDVHFGSLVQILGMANIRIGQGSVVADGCWLNVTQRDEQVRMVIGRSVLIGRQSHISAGGFLEIGDHCLFAPQVYVSDANHVVDDITRPYAEQGATAGRIIVEENCWLGIHAVVMGDIILGRGCVVAANAVVNKTIPPFCIVAGVPARIIKMFDPRTNAWAPATTTREQQAILEAREQTPLPTREEYRFILSKTSKRKEVNPILAGKGQHM